MTAEIAGASSEREQRFRARRERHWEHVQLLTAGTVLTPRELFDCTYTLSSISTMAVIPPKAGGCMQPYEKMTYDQLLQKKAEIEAKKESLTRSYHWFLVLFNGAAAIAICALMLYAFHS